MSEVEGMATSPDAHHASKAKPWASLTIVAAICAVMVLPWFGIGRTFPEHFAKVDQRILAGELWRLFTASFLHVNLVHLCVNVISLLSIGPIVERLFGPVRLLVVFLFGGAVGFLASALLVPAPSVGASAGICALLGAACVRVFQYRNMLDPTVVRRFAVDIAGVLTLNSILGLTLKGIDNAAHLGGVLGGAGLGFLLSPHHALSAADLPGVDRGARLAWAGQGWKLACLQWAAIVGFVVALQIGQDPLTGFVVGSTLGFAAALTARCPRCKDRIVWRVMSDPTAGGMKALYTATACKVCGFPGPVAPATEAPRELRDRPMHNWMDWCAYVLILGGAGLIAFGITARSYWGAGGFLILWGAIAIRARQKSLIISIGGGLLGAFVLLTAALLLLSPSKPKSAEKPAIGVLKR